MGYKIYILWYQGIDSYAVIMVTFNILYIFSLISRLIKNFKQNQFELNLIKYKKQVN